MTELHWVQLAASVGTVQCCFILPANKLNSFTNFYYHLYLFLVLETRTQVICWHGDPGTSQYMSASLTDIAHLHPDQWVIGPHEIHLENDFCHPLSSNSPWHLGTIIWQMTTLVRLTQQLQHTTPFTLKLLFSSFVTVLSSLYPWQYSEQWV